ARGPHRPRRDGRERPGAEPDAGGQGPVRPRPPDVARPGPWGDLLGNDAVEPLVSHQANGAEDGVRSAVNDCVHCGFCLPACPTYQLWGEEMDSPRGRIHLITQILDSGEGSAAAAEHFDRCLGCMACMTACPSGVQYDQLIEAARGWGEGETPPAPLPPWSLRARLVGAAIFAPFPYPNRLRAALGPLRAAQRTGLDRLAAR